jgi:extracellular factor (EF) 3-hydroxypalmitic acid methyl ester biosynthesis protein
MAGSRSAASELAPAAEPRRTGRAKHGGRTLELVASCATRLSLRVEIKGGVHLASGSVLEELELDLERGRVRLGHSRFAAAGGAARGARGDLVFLDDVYDCRSLVHDCQLLDLRGFFQNLPLVLAQRERIRDDFRHHCANLAYDLAVYRRFFDEQDRLIVDAPGEVAETAREVVLRTEGRRFLSFLDERVAELGTLVRGFSVDEHERHGFYLRRHLWPYLLASECLRRTNLKPAGYSGDAEVMVMLYENSYRGGSTFEQLMHKYPVETRAADAVRSRRRVVPRLLREAEARSPARAGPFRFLSLACGPGYELEEIFATRADLERFDCALLDQDPRALDLAREVVRRIDAKHHGRPPVRYLEESVRTMLRTRDLRTRFGAFDFIYSMGLFDYLTGPVARAVLARTFDLLAPGGEIVVGNFHVTSPTRIYMDYWADWTLIYRTEESFLALADGLPAASARIDFDETGCQMFLRLQRPA